MNLIGSWQGIRAGFVVVVPPNKSIQATPKSGATEL